MAFTSTSNALTGAESDNLGNGVGPVAEVGDLDIFGTVAINGLGPDLTIVNANGIDRVFAVYGPSEGGGYLGNATISGLTMTGGHVIGNANHGGGGIQTRDDGHSILTNVVIRGNSIVNAPGDRRGGMFGGGVENVEDNATTTIDHSVITGNTVTADGTPSPNLVVNDGFNGNPRDPRGGGVIAGSGTVTVTDSQISNNVLTTTGGAGSFATGGGVASAGGAIVLNRVSITGNTATAATPFGGAIGMVGKTHQASVYNGTTMTLTTPFAPGVHSTFTGTNVTISGNTSSAGDSGGVFLGAAVDATFNLSTIYGNTTPGGPRIRRR